ncbi:MAG: SH3-like domain-containing protein [Limisphaerales bacterium]
MTSTSSTITNPTTRIVKALGEEPAFKVGEQIRISLRYPVGHYRVPMYMRGKRGIVELILEPKAVNNEEEGFGRNAGLKGYYYRVGVPLTELWPGYAGSPQDRLVIEVFESWLERI